MAHEKITSSDAAIVDTQVTAPSRLLANLTHELKTPLHSILTVADLLAKQADGPLNEEQHKQVDIIKRNGEILLGLISDLLNYSAASTSERLAVVRRFEPIAYIAELCDAIRPIAQQKQIHLDIRLESNAQLFFSDKVLLQRIVTNLLSNSLKFSAAGSSVALDAWLDPSNCLHLQVSDAGIGMDKETKHKAFQEFYQAQSNDDRSAGGVGLGLSLVQHAVEQLQGKIEVQSEKGQGTLFYLQLPSLKAELLKTRILHFTKDPTMGMVLKECLEHEGFKPVALGSVAELMKGISVNKPDILFVDLDGVESTAAELLKDLRQSLVFDEVPIIAISSSQQVGMRTTCFAAGATDFLGKPFNVTELLARLHTHLDK